MLGRGVNAYLLRSGPVAQPEQTPLRSAFAVSQQRLVLLFIALRDACGSRPTPYAGALNRREANPKGQTTDFLSR